VDNKNVEEPYSVKDLLDTAMLQRIQDDFARIADVGSIIYDLDGSPITEPSNFSEYCRLIRSTPKGLQNCIESDAKLARMALKEREFAKVCQSGRLMDGIAPIFVRGRRIANWGIGQVLFKELDEDWVCWYARDIGLREEDLLNAYKKLKLIPEEQFIKTIKYLMIFSSELSRIALANLKLTREIQNRRKSEERYSAIVKNAIVGICELTNDGNLEYVNDQLSELSGFSKEELVGRNIKTILDSQRDFESYFNGIADYANKSFANVGYDFHGFINHKNGSKTPCRVCMTPQKNLSKQVVKSSAVIIDTSAEKQALEELEQRNRELYESKKQSDLFFDNNTNGLCIYDRHLKRIKCNRAYMNFVKEYKKVDDYQQGRIWEPFEKNTLNKILQGKLGEVEVKKEYGIQLYSVKASPIYDYEHDITHLLVTIEDITNYQLMMENARFAEKMSGAGMMASGIAHDMKSIFSILGNSNNALKSIIRQYSEQKCDERMERILQTQENGLHNGRRLLTQLLSYSGRKTEEKERFQLKEAIEKIVRIYNSSILEKNAEVSMKIREGVFIESISSKFIQIFMNLFSNALDAISINGHITIEESSDNGVLYITVNDDGIGISSEETDQVFKAFYTSKHQGTGLGLFSVKNIIDELGGFIHIQPGDPKGTIFSITIRDNEMVKTWIES
jgi:PAS domain S-box-containing protein